MKVTLLVLLLSISNWTTAQNLLPAQPIPIDSSTGLVQFQQAVIVDSLRSAEDVIRQVRAWIFQSYRLSGETIQQYEPSADMVICEGVFPVQFTNFQSSLTAKSTKTAYVQHTMTIEAKPGQARITVNGFLFRLTAERAQYHYRPAIGPDDLDLVRQEETLRQRFNAGSGWVKRNAPVYLNSQRSLDAGVYQTVNGLLGSFTQFMAKKEKDW